MRALHLILLTAVLAVVVSGCGSKEEVRTLGETEGTYLDVGDLKYQIQLSRYLNSNDVEDKAYLLGLPPGTEEPAGDETWFGVWLRVQNETDRTITPANDFEIVDTLDNVYRPIPLDRNANPFAFQSDPIAPMSLIPEPDSVASEGVIQGSLLLFKVKTSSLQNRPLEFHFRKGSGTTGTVDLDV